MHSAQNGWRGADESGNIINETAARQKSLHSHTAYTFAGKFYRVFSLPYWKPVGPHIVFADCIVCTKKHLDENAWVCVEMVWRAQRCDFLACRSTDTTKQVRTKLKRAFLYRCRKLFTIAFNTVLIVHMLRRTRIANAWFSRSWKCRVLVAFVEGMSMELEGIFWFLRRLSTAWRIGG